MNTMQVLSDALFADPDNFTLAGALRDHLFGDLEWVYSEADKKVDEVIQLGRYARDLVTAAELVKPGAELRKYLLGTICTAAGVPNGAQATVFLVPGEQRATLVVADSVWSSVSRAMHNVTIGATRVVRIARSGDVHKGPRRTRGKLLIP